MIFRALLAGGQDGGLALYRCSSSVGHAAKNMFWAVMDGSSVAGAWSGCEVEAAE
jgi:hypothetical protein